MLLEMAAAVPVVSGIGFWGWLALTSRLTPPSIRQLAPPASPPAQIELPPAQPWTREDAAKSAAMYREVPSAFWLAPEYTRFDGPSEPLPWAAEPSRVLRGERDNALPGTFQGRRVVSYSYDVVRMGWRLKLEKKATDISDPWVFMTDGALDDWRRGN